MRGTLALVHLVLGLAALTASAQTRVEPKVFMWQQPGANLQVPHDRVSQMIRVLVDADQQPEVPVDRAGPYTTFSITNGSPIDAGGVASM